MYMVSEFQAEHEGGWGFAFWDLMKPDGTTYRIVCDRDGNLSCDCPDATYRERTCKHATALREAYQWLEDQQRREAAAAAYTGDPPF
jgi:hypothetical protein